MNYKNLNQENEKPSFISKIKQFSTKIIGDYVPKVD